eukprot:TRINITY_DN3966_c0_g1_i2.p1 TRINITY_DN3966_c0_g1~~TRINITY_DN3966_c0_g1_i2.p1  ORF type:complete len:105 (+),score=3.67 TRINITY_DN3966_c0_g1_i2:172-486(+)
MILVIENLLYQCTSLMNNLNCRSEPTLHRIFKYATFTLKDQHTSLILKFKTCEFWKATLDNFTIKFLGCKTLNKIYSNYFAPVASKLVSNFYIPYTLPILFKKN